MKQQLNKKQAIRAGIIFLNNFGIKVNKQDNDNSYPLTIGNDVVGILTVNEQDIRIRAEFEDFELTANYNIPYASGMEDYEDGLGSGIAFVDWNTDINFELKSNQANITGKVIISAKMDRAFGNGCNFYPRLEVKNSSLGNYKLDFLNRGNVFLYENFDGETKEIIQMGYAEFDFSIVHQKQYELDENREGYSPWGSRTVESVFDRDRQNCIQIYSFDQIKNDGRTTTNVKLQENEDYIDPNDMRSKRIQIAKAFRKISPQSIELIKAIRDSLQISSCNIFDNFIVSCFSRYDKEMISSYLGYTPNPVIYQNNTTNLEDAYFGSKSENINLLER